MSDKLSSGSSLACGSPQATTGLACGSPQATTRLACGSPQVPIPFGQYELLGLIARGGMAEVFRARKRGAESEILAIKCMRPQLAKEARFVEMFIREGKLAVLLQNDAIVRTFEIGRIEGRYFIAMEYIGGKDLTQVLRRCQEQHQRIPVPHAVYITAQTALGLHYAHTLNDAEGRPLTIVNRDVSPSNIRVSYDGQVKMLDFGIAQAMLKFTSEIGVLKGKFSYMSPEQIRGLPVDARTDIFSTGIVLHEMLTTEKLFRGDTEFQLMEKVRNADVTPPSKFNRRVPEALDAICMKALARDAQDRYATAAELAADLLKLLEGYRFTTAELRDLVRSLFRQDHQQEETELEACRTAPSSHDGAGPRPPTGDAPGSAAPAAHLEVEADLPPASEHQSPAAPPAAPAKSGGLWSKIKAKLS